MAIWDAATGKRIVEFPVKNDVITGPAFAPDGKTVVSGDCVRRGQVVGREDRQAPGAAAKANRGNVRALAFSPDGKVLASGSGDYRGQRHRLVGRGDEEARSQPHGAHRAM